MALIKSHVRASTLETILTHQAGFTVCKPPAKESHGFTNTTYILQDLAVRSSVLEPSVTLSPLCTACSKIFIACPLTATVSSVGLNWWTSQSGGARRWS